MGTAWTLIIEAAMLFVAAIVVGFGIGAGMFVADKLHTWLLRTKN